MKPTQKDGKKKVKVQANPGKTLQKHYKRFIAPFEQSMQFKRMVSNTTSPSTSSSSSSSSPCQEDDSRGVDDNTLRELIELCKRLVSKLTVPSHLLTKFQTQSDMILEALEERSETKKSLGIGKVVPILGESRKGKSFLFNQILAMTEVPAANYNTSQQHQHSIELSEDAAHIATRVYMEDKDIPSTDETYQQIFSRIFATAEPINLTSAPRKYSSNLSSVEWNIPGIHNPGIAKKNVSKNDFTEHFTINAERDRYKHASQKDVVDAFQNFMKVAGQKLETNGEFLLPCRPRQKSVTSHNTYVWGGECYAMVVRFISAKQIKTWIDMQSEPEKDTKYQSTVKKMLLHVLYTLEFGTQCGDTPDAIDESKEKRKDTINTWMKSKELPSWWEEKGSVVDSETSTYKNIHSSVREQFGKIHIFQGAGKHAHDDRVYIRSVLAKLMETALIAEVHIIAPSWLVTRFSALVDTPGAGDADGSKFPRIHDVVDKANGFIVYVVNVLGSEATTRNLLEDHGIYERMAAGWVAQPRKDLVLFVDSTEIGPAKVPRPLERDDEESMIGEKWTAELKERRKAFEDDLADTLVDAIDRSLISDEEAPVTNSKKAPVANSKKAPGAGDEPLTTDDDGSGEGTLRYDRATVRREIAKPISKERHVTVFPAMHRAIIESMALEPDGGVLSQNEPVTGVSLAISKIWEMLNTEISTKSLNDFSELCTDVKENATLIPNCDVSLEIRNAVKVVLKRKGTSHHEQLRACIEASINNMAKSYEGSLMDFGC